MYPAIAFESVGAFVTRNKYKMIKALASHLLRIYYVIVIVCVAIVADRAYKLFIEDSYKVVVDIYHLVHTTEEFQEAFVLYAIGIGGLDNFTSFLWIFLVIIIGKSFGKIGWKISHALGCVEILVNQPGYR